MLIRKSFLNLRFEDSIAIGVPAAAAFAFFGDMEHNYTRWHPDHMRFEWRRGRGIAEDNVFYFEERIAGKRLRKEVRILKVLPDRYFAFEPTNRLLRFFLPLMSFGFEPDGAGCVFRATVDLHGVGPLGARLNRRELDAVDRHMAEEGRNLKAIFEGGANP